MNKRSLHHYYTVARDIHGGVWLAAGLILLVIGVFAARGNNLRMIELRDAVYAADESGEGLNEALVDLREHVHGHMNTRLSTDLGIYPPIRLSGEFNRLLSAERARVSAINEGLQTEAQDYCERTNPAGFFGASRLDCVNEYLDANGANERPIPQALYQFDFASPAWSPDLAGWSLLAGACLVILGLFFSTTKYLLRRASR